MENTNNTVNIPLLGIARSGSDASCIDGKSNEIINLEQKNGSLYPYSSTKHSTPDINKSQRVYIHKTTNQINWIKILNNKLYWTKDSENNWKEISDVKISSYDTPVDVTGNIISLGSGTHLIFKDNKYIKFDIRDLQEVISFKQSNDKILGIRKRYKWDVLATMERTQSEGFANVICGLYNKLDDRAITENLLIGAAYFCYAIKLYDGTYIKCSAPVLLKNFDYNRVYYKNWDEGSELQSYNHNEHATPFFGTIYGHNKGCSEFGGKSGCLIEAEVGGLHSGIIPTDSLKFQGLRETDFAYGSWSIGSKTNARDYLKTANLKVDTYRDCCSWVYKNLKYSWEDSIEGNRNVQAEDKVFYNDINNVTSNQFNTEEMSCVSCIADSYMNGSDLHDFCDVYAFRTASKVTFDIQKVFSQSKYKDIILSVDIFMTKPVLPVYTDKQDVRDNFQCVEHRRIKERNTLNAELEQSLRAFYKIREIPLEEFFVNKKYMNNEKSLSLKNIELHETLSRNSNHVVMYNNSFSYNNKIHISDISYKLYNSNPFFFTTTKNTNEKDADITLGFKLLINGKEYNVESGSYKFTKHIGNFISYPDSRAKSARISIRKDGYYYYKEFTLKASEYVDFAYYEDTENNYITKDFTSWSKKKAIDFYTNNIVKDNNKNVLKVSYIDNPIVFPYSNTYVIGNGDIIGMSSNTVALSQGQFGEYDLYVFSTDGIWAMKVDESGRTYYSKIVPVSREVCNNKNSICQIDGGIVFSSRKGLMIISGNNAIELSEELKGLPSRMENRVFNTAINNSNLVRLKDIISNDDFVDYLNNTNTFVVYLYRKNKLLISNKEYNYSYLFCLKTKVTTKISESFIFNIKDYPNEKLIDKAYNVFEFPINSNEEYIDTLIETRPIKLGNHAFKSNKRLVFRGEFSTPEENYKYLSINEDDYKIPYNDVLIKNPTSTKVELKTFNEEPIDVYKQDGLTYVDISLLSYKIGEKAKTLIGFNDENQPIYKDVTINGYKEPEYLLTPTLSDSCRLYNDGGYTSMIFGIKRDKHYRNMQILNPKVLIKDVYDDNFIFIADLSTRTGEQKGLFKDDNNTNYTIVKISDSNLKTLEYKDSYYIDSIYSYDSYYLRSFSFIENYHYRMHIPYVDEDGVVTIKSFEKIVRDDYTGDKKVPLTDILLNKKVYGYNRLTYDYTGYTKVDDYNGDGKYDGEDILTWIKLSLDNTDMLKEYKPKIKLEKDKYYKYDEYVESTTIEFKPKEKYLDDEVQADYSFGLVTQVKGQYFDGAYIKGYSDDAIKAQNFAGNIDVTYTDVDEEKQKSTFKLNTDWKIKRPDNESNNDWIVKGVVKGAMFYKKYDGNQSSIVTSYLYDDIPVANTDPKGTTYTPQFFYFTNDGLVNYDSYDVCMLNLELGKIYEVFIPYIEDKEKGILGVKRHVFKVREDIQDYVLKNINGEEKKLIGAYNNNIRSEYAIGTYVKDVIKWLEELIKNPDYTSNPNVIISGDPIAVQLNNGENYRIIDIDGESYEFSYTLETKLLSYEEIKEYISKGELTPPKTTTKNFYYRDDTKEFLYEEFIEYINTAELYEPPKYIPEKLTLEDNTHIEVFLDNELLALIIYKGEDNIKTEEFMNLIGNEEYESYETISKDTIIDGLFENVNVSDEIEGISFSFYSNYERGETTYETLINDYKEGKLEKVREIDSSRYINIENDTIVTLCTNGEYISFIYTGKNYVTFEELIANLDSYEKVSGKLVKKHIGLYVFGSIDCQIWGFIGGVERSGKNLRDIQTKIENMSVKYIKLLFVGNISKDSHIDSIEIQSSIKYGNKIR